MVHCARMKRRNLIIVQIRRDIGLGRISTVDGLDIFPADAVVIHPLGIGLEVTADRPHGNAITAQKSQRIRNIPGATAKFTTHLRNQKGDIQHMNTIRQNFILELAGVDHDGVKGKGAADKCRHDCPFVKWMDMRKLQLPHCSGVVTAGGNQATSGSYLRSSFLAAATSSSRRTGRVTGASFRMALSSFASFQMAIMASTKRSSVSRDSVSVGS